LPWPVATRLAIALWVVLADPWAVDTEHHRLALAAVQDRLRQRFPNVDATVVEAAVRISHAELTGQGDGFVPQLVERAAHNRLSYALTEQPPQPAPTSLSQPRTPNVMP
jgi:hypothetical protein